MGHTTSSSGPNIRVVIIMGVSGSGKSTVGAALAEVLDCPFLEGDDFHSDANVAKMRSGLPLDDADRWPWFDGLAEAANEAIVRGEVVVSCSALKRRYRERLKNAINARCFFVMLETTADQLARRMNDRAGHYMPISLLRSQLEALEPPSYEEHALVLDAARSVKDLCAEIQAFVADGRGWTSDGDPREDAIL